MTKIEVKNLLLLLEKGKVSPNTQPKEHLKNIACIKIQQMAIIFYAKIMNGKVSEMQGEKL
jgi:hypothetical protein